MPGFFGSLFGTFVVEALQRSRLERKAQRLGVGRHPDQDGILQLLTLYDPLPQLEMPEATYVLAAADVAQFLSSHEHHSTTDLDATVSRAVRSHARGSVVDERALRLLAKRLVRMLS